MALAQILPPRNLLEQVEGVESGLRRSQRATLIGVLLAAVQATFLIANSQWLQSLWSGDWSYVFEHWPLLVCLFLFVLSATVAGWARFWVKESRRPFRYTYSIAPFEPLAGAREQPLLIPLHADLRERLSERIGRLSLLEGDAGGGATPEAAAEGTAPAQPESHIHVSGAYAVRTRPPDPRWFVEVTPWVQVGGPSRPAKLATPVRYALEKQGGHVPPSPTSAEYEHILERAYFTIATAIYRQIQEDVDRKIALLPSRWFRASALFHEAQDHARSNTLDAYETARKLYWKAILLYDPAWEPLPQASVRRRLAQLRIAAAGQFRELRGGLSTLVPRIARAEVLTTRAEIGFATMLLDTGVLASLSGLRSRAAFAAAPIARDARDRLLALDGDVPNRDRSLFDALACVAQVESWMGAENEGEKALQEAASLDPRRADNDPRYLFAKATLEPRLKAKISAFRTTVEHAERFETASFEFAYHSEMLWRTRPTLERSVANTVRGHYADVLKVNPSNLGAWANRGYVAWLLGDAEGLDAAKRCFDTGRRFKEIKRETYVAELDHGLARVAAETGEFDSAYSHYVAAVAARISEGGRQNYHDYYYERIGAEMLARFRHYAEAVGDHYSQPRSDQLETTTPRIRRSVYAFALTDYGEACLAYFLAVGDPTALDEASAILEQATELNEEFVVPWLALARVEWERQMLDQAEGDPNVHADRVEALEPGWEEAAPQLLAWHSERARKLRADAEVARDKAESAARRDAELGFERSYETEAPQPAPASTLNSRALQLREEATRHERRARELQRTLVPHAWLWRWDPVTGDEFAWDEIHDARAKQALRWETSFEIPHVRGLIAWCWVLVQAPDPPVELDSLLDLIEERFFPNDADLMTLRWYRATNLAEADEGSAAGHTKLAKEYEDRIALKAGRALDEDPTSFAALRDLNETTTPSAPRLEERALASDLPPFVHAWVGRKLLVRTQEVDDDRARELAEIAFEKAKTANHARTLLDVGDGLEELGRSEEALRIFRKATRRAKEPRVMTTLAERLEGRDDLKRALKLYAAARSKDRGAASERAQEEYTTSVGRLLWLTGERERALKELAGVPRSGGQLGPYWRTWLITQLSASSALDGDAYTLLRPWLGAGQRSAILDGDDEAAQDCAAAAQKLARGDLWLGEVEAMPFADPIRLEGSHLFYPEGEDTPAVKRMLEEDIPRLRDQVRSTTGVVVPGIRLRSESGLPARDYRVLIMEAQVEAGTVPADVDDPYRFMLDRVTAAVRSRLSAFVDMQALEAVGEEATGDGTNRFSVQQMLPTERDRRGFLRFVKALVRDGVSVGDLAVLLRVFREQNGNAADVDWLVAQTRLRLTEKLIGRDAARTRLDPAIERQIAAAVASTAGSLHRLDPDELTRLREAIHDLIPGPEAAVVTSAELRPWVKQLAQAEGPLLHVFSDEELEVTPGMST